MSYIANVYAELVRKGEKTVDNIPEKIKNEVIVILISRGIITEE